MRIGRSHGHRSPGEVDIDAAGPGAEGVAGQQVGAVAALDHELGAQAQIDVVGQRHGLRDVGVARTQDVGDVIGRQARLQRVGRGIGEADKPHAFAHAVGSACDLRHVEELVAVARLLGRDIAREVAEGAEPAGQRIGLERGRRHPAVLRIDLGLIDELPVAGELLIPEF